MAQVNKLHPEVLGRMQPGDNGLAEPSNEEIEDEDAEEDEWLDELDENGEAVAKPPPAVPYPVPTPGVPPPPPTQPPSTTFDQTKDRTGLTIASPSQWARWSLWNKPMQSPAPPPVGDVTLHAYQFYDISDNTWKDFPAVNTMIGGFYNVLCSWDVATLTPPFASGILVVTGHNFNANTPYELITFTPNLNDFYEWPANEGAYEQHFDLHAQTITDINNNLFDGYFHWIGYDSTPQAINSITVQLYR